MKRLTVVITIIIGMFLITSCAKEQVKETEKVGVDMGAISASNAQLAKYPVTGFAYKSSKVPAQEWDKWAKVAAPVIKEIVNNLPEGYVLEVRGHADARGPETAEGNKPGNMKISTDRAKAVYDSLGKAGISSPKMVYKGAGSSETMSSADATAAEQRRVTFGIVQK